MHWFSIITAIVTAIMLLTPTLFLGHYATFWVPFGALALSLSAAPGAGGPRRAGREGRRPRAARATLVAVLTDAVLVTGTLQLAEVEIVAPMTVPVARILESVIPPGARVVTNDPSATLSAGRFVSSDPTCPPAVDTYGTGLDLNPSGTSGFYSPQLKAFWKTNLAKAQFLLYEGSESSPDGERP